MRKAERDRRQRPTGRGYGGRLFRQDENRGPRQARVVVRRCIEEMKASGFVLARHTRIVMQGVSLLDE